MILRSLNRTLLHKSARPGVPGVSPRSRFHSEDAAERITRLADALRRYGVDVPQTQSTETEEIFWID